MQLTFNKEALSTGTEPVGGVSSLAELRCGESAVLESLDVAEDFARRLMELGFFPGGSVVVAGCAPGGDPRVYRVDGSEIALRVETARSLMVQTASIRAVDSKATSRQ